MRFPFAQLPAKPDAAFPHRTYSARPILSIVLEKSGLSILTFAIVDSGADTCLFPESITKELGITIPNQNAMVFSGTAEDPQIAYFETVRATIWNGKSAEAPISFDLYAGFCSTLEHVGMGLLGQEGFFSRFDVAIRHRSSFFEIIP